MDNIDTAILDCLKKNGRVTASEISKKVKLSIPALPKEYVNSNKIRLFKSIQSSSTAWQTGQKLLAFIFVNIDKTEHINAFRSQITVLPGVLECHHLAGAYDYLLKVSVSDTDALESFLTNKLKKSPASAVLIPLLLWQR